MPGQNIDRTVPPPWASWDVAFMLLRAAGHAAVYGVAVWLVESAKDDNNFDMIGPPAMACAFVVWLLIVGRSSGPSILRLIATGYTTVAPAALMVLFAFGASAESTLRLGVLILPLVLLVTGTAAAVVTVAYGLTLRHGSRLARRKGWFGSSHARDRQALPPRSGEPTADTLTRQSAGPSSYQPHDIHPLRAGLLISESRGFSNQGSSDSRCLLVGGQQAWPDRIPLIFASAWWLRLRPDRAVGQLPAPSKSAWRVW